MKKYCILVAIAILASFYCSAQYTRYIVSFTDKAGNPYSLSNPSQYLSQRAIDRRTRYQVAIDSTDLPITPRYIDSLRAAGNVSILAVSKWLNQVAISTTDAAAIVKINSLPFVRQTRPIAARVSSTLRDKKIPDSIAPLSITATAERPDGIAGYYDYGRSAPQVKIHKGDFLHDHGFRGEGMQMAVLDAGFYHYLTLPTFDSIRANQQVLATWDFVTGDPSVNEDNSHGMQCLSTIAANMPGTFIGTAPKTSFYLFRTEDVNSEYPIEEQNLAAGAERADSLGVDICSVSLGYSTFDDPVFDYTYPQLDGNTTISARAADLAAKKGMLMVVALGNEGNNSWNYLITPADADSVLSVGAVDTLGRVASFSSYGPSVDGQVKPAVAAVGSYAIVANTSNGLPSFGFGTSFACPNMAGISTCLWQAFPEVSNMTIINMLEASANRFASPDNRTGYGIPDAKKAFVMLQKQLYQQQSRVVDCKFLLNFRVKTDPTMRIIIERKTPLMPLYSEVGNLQNTQAFAAHDFNFEDNLAGIPAGMVNYRVKMMITADSTYYLDSMTIEHLPACVNVNQNNILVGPNPVHENLGISITRTANTRVGIVIQNAAGQRIYRNQYIQDAGSQLINIPFSGKPRGAYVVTIYFDGKKEVTRKIVVN